MNEHITENPMGTRPVLPLLLSMSIPPIISMLIQSMYNVVDSIFLARYSQDALTAVSLAYPLQNLALAVACGLGIGVNSCMSRSLGERNQKMTDSVAVHGAVCTMAHGLLFILLGLFFTEPFIGMFTQDESVYSMACTYSRIVICLAFGSMFHIYIEKMFQATGNMVAPMFLQIAGAVINIVLDPILIFGYLGFPAMGITGAAIATVIGQMSAFLLSVLMFRKQNGGVQVTLKGFHPDKEVLKKIYSVGIPSGLMISLPSILVGILNGILAGVSQTAVAVLGLYIKLQSFVYMPANGVVQGLRPIVGYCYGAGKHDRIHKALKSSILCIGAIMAVGTLLFLGFPGQILALFDAEGELLSIGMTALRITCLGFVISTVSLVYAGAFEALGRGTSSLIISLARQLLVTPVLALILVQVWGLDGVWIAFPAAEILAAGVAVYLFGKFRRHIPNR